MARSARSSLCPPAWGAPRYSMTWCRLSDGTQVLEDFLVVYIVTIYLLYIVTI